MAWLINISCTSVPENPVAFKNGYILPFSVYKHIENVIIFQASPTINKVITGIGN